MPLHGLSILAASALIAGAGPCAGAVFNVRQFGATGDGKTLDTKSIQAAIGAASQAGGGIVLLPRGAYLSGSLQMKSHVELHLDADAVLLGSASRGDYQKGRWYALLLADGQEDLTISGSGAIDGQGRALVEDVIRRVKEGEIKDPMAGNRPDVRERPLLIEFRRCRRVHIAGVTLRDSASWVQNYIGCEDLSIDGIRVNSTAYWNNDGMDITDCRKVRIAHVDVNSDDDGICLKSGVGGAGCDDVEIAACRVRSSASAFKCGTASRGAFRNIRVHGLDVYDTYRSAIALETVDGAVLQNVRIENVRAVNTGNAIFLRLGHRDPNAPIGVLEDVQIRGLKVEVPAGRPDEGYETLGPPVRRPHNVFPSSIVGLPDHPIRNVLLEDIEIRYPGGGRPETANVPFTQLQLVPERAAEYPEFSMFGELPAWAFYVRHAQGIEFRNLRVALKETDFRSALVFDDVRKLRLQGVDTGPLSGAPVIVLNQVQDSVFHDVRYPSGIAQTVRWLGGSSNN
jgi:hypothetical protein